MGRIAALALAFALAAVAQATAEDCESQARAARVACEQDCAKIANGTRRTRCLERCPVLARTTRRACRGAGGGGKAGGPRQQGRSGP